MAVVGCEGGPVPRALVAFTVHVYVLPALKPVTVNGPALAEVVLVTPPILELHVAEYFVIGEPLLFGTPNATRSTPRPTRTARAAVTAAGAPTVTDTDMTDGGPSTSPFSAVTVNVYVTPFVRPDTTVVVPNPGINTDSCATDPRYGVTTYPAKQLAPVNGGAQLTTAEPFPGAFDNVNGADGTVVQRVALGNPNTSDRPDGGPVPIMFDAVTEHSYGVPATKPATVIGDPIPAADIDGSPSNEKHVAVYPEIADPPSLPGGEKLTTAEPTPSATATPITGAPGTPGM